MDPLKRNQRETETKSKVENKYLCETQEKLKRTQLKRNISHSLIHYFRIFSKFAISKHYYSEQMTAL